MSRLDQRTRNLLGAAAAGFGSVLLLGGLCYWYLQWRFYPLDTLTYFLAGARLNEAHALYDLVPGDVWIAEKPEFPLLSPPLIAVLWRPLAALPDQLGMLIWLLAISFVTFLATFLTIVGTRGWSGLLVAALMPSLVLLIGVGNLDGLVLLGAIVAWLLVQRGQEAKAGIIVGILVSLKLTPGALVLWLLIGGHRRALAWTVVSAAACLIVVIAGAGLEAPFRYVQVVRDAAADGRWWALTALVIWIALMWHWRTARRRTFVLAVLLIPIGSPVAALHSWAVLLAATAPWISWPGRRLPDPDQEAARTRTNG